MKFGDVGIGLLATAMALLVGLVFVFVGNPESWKLAAGCVVLICIGWTLIFFAWRRLSLWRRSAKLVAALVLIALSVLASFPFIRNQYRKEHTPPEVAKKADPLPPAEPITTPRKNEAAAKEALKEILLKKTPPTNNQSVPTPAPLQQPSTVTNNAPGGIANSGTINGPATVNNYGPIDRHLNASQVEALNQAVKTLPKSVADGLEVYCAHDGDSERFALEIAKAISPSGYKEDNITIAFDATGKGLYVFVQSNEDAVFPYAQGIANALAKGTHVEFHNGTIPPGHIRIFVLSQ